MGPHIPLFVRLQSARYSFLAYCSLLDGRRPVYLAALPLLVVSSFGVSTSQNMHELLCWRFIQAIGASPGMTIGSAVIGDIYKIEERGAAMGIFWGVSRIF